DGETSAENNSSTILLLNIDKHYALLTADACMPALHAALDILEAAEFDPKQISFVQIPHHGSRRNVGPTLLDRLIGPKLSSEQSLKSAFVSVAPDAGEKHPSKRVTNAFKRTGAAVHATSGQTKCHWHNAPSRDGWVASEPLPFFAEVEDSPDE